MDYSNDPYAQACVKALQGSKAKLAFGAVLLNDRGEAIASGRNRRARNEDRRFSLTHIDYAVHAEQDACLQALMKSIEPNGGTLYVLGRYLHGPRRGLTTVRTDARFTCARCATSVLIPFQIQVAIPLQSGWRILSPAEALCGAKTVRGTGYWQSFVP
jgi:hypothetical protein